MSEPKEQPDLGGLGRLVVDFVRDMIPEGEIASALGEGDRAAWRARYWSDPVAFARDHFRWPRDARGRVRWLTDYQQDALVRLHRNKRLALYGPRGLGKTRVSAVSVWHFYFTRDGFVDWKMPITAGGYRQIEQYLFPEIHSLARMIRWDKVGRRPLSRRDELMKLTIEGQTGRAFGAASTDAALIEGAHAPQLLYIIDESKAVADAVYDAIEGMSVASGLDDREMYILSSSTPGPQLGRFYKICSWRERDDPAFSDWDVRHVTPEEAIRAGRMNPRWAKQRAQQWGTTSALYQCHVLGKFADTGSDGVIPYFWAEAAKDRGAHEAAGPVGDEGADRVVLGVDVSAGGSAESVIAVRKGWACTELIAWQSSDTMKVVERVIQVAQRVKPNAIVVDAVGVGAGVYDRLNELGFPVVPFRGGDAAEESDSSGEMKFLNRRAWAWWHMRELLHPHGPVTLVLPDDEKLIAQLALPTYAKTQHDFIKIESKDEIAKRIKKLTQEADPTESPSPDRADALVYAFSDAGLANFEEAYAASGLHTAQSLARLPDLPPGERQKLLVEQTVLAREAEAAAVAERERRILEREQAARPVVVQVEDLLWRDQRQNHSIWDP